MRLLYLPLNVGGAEQHGTVAGFREVLGGGNVHVFDYLDQARKIGEHTIRDAMLHKVEAVNPDWIHMQIQSERCVTPELIRHIKRLWPKIIITHWMGDWRASVPPVLRELCQLCDVSFLSNEGQLPMYRAFGRTEYWQIASYAPEFCDLDDIHGMPFKVPDVVFCGNHYGDTFPGGGQRLAVVEAFIRSGLPFGIVGGGWPDGVKTLGSTGLKEQKHIYMAARVSVGVNNINDCERYYSERQLSAMSVPRPHVCWGVPGLDKDFVDGEHCLFYQTPEEAVQKVRELLADPERAARIGEAGRVEVMRAHLWPERIREIMPLVTSIHEDKGAVA